MVNLNNYHLTFDDEFSGTSIAAANWNVATTPNQTHFLLDQPKASNVTVSDGLLHMRANKGDTTDGLPYSTAAIDTKGHVVVQYGYIEASIKVPDAKGMTPAFWLYPQSGMWTHEIDIMEMFLADPTTNGMTLHYGGDTGHDQFLTSSFTGPDFSAGFHTFGMEWTPSKITWSIDGVDRFTVTSNIPTEPMYVLLTQNTDDTRSWNSVDSTTPFPNVMDVDYVRVYAANTAPPPPPPIVTTHQLSLILAEDAWKGDAQFIVKVDGAKVGGSKVTALHSAGATQEFDYTGKWSAGVHDVEIDFTNDKYGGVGKDRALYVEGVKDQGGSYLSQEHAMYHNEAFDVVG